MIEISLVQAIDIYIHILTRYSHDNTGKMKFTSVQKQILTLRSKQKQCDGTEKWEIVVHILLSGKLGLIGEIL